MRYLNTDDIKKIGIKWEQTIEAIREAVTILHQHDIAQPIKPYLRYRDPGNRIIAMPAFVGGDVNMAGIKWISSFPKNIQKGIQRAHSVTVLNDADTGKPLAVLNTALISGIRTASVTGLIIKKYEEIYPLEDVTVGIIGFGPIGQLHLQMVMDILGDRISKVLLYDIAGVKMDLIPEAIKNRVEVTESWEEAYGKADVFITCTVSPNGYIDQKPKERSLLLNVSLRDFKPEILDYTQSIIVDDWEEVCRENTDIELMHLQRGLQKSDTKSITEIVCEDQMKSFPADKPILFNPMGMAIFDVATSKYYYLKALENGVGTELAE
ncbi:2,3-diaminopropionate biosynthesis protein SbnB [Paenibacillus tengchongensis]|uniref:2,3-diaminopropionate biosynthesis protein SbnB n=1 Tax=Paenibacillus tengchongensis TaxID=2608684 RepID=UPI00124E5A3B|nr:2,3-diaminopropionate biosynthesis protein SbnB [Paenibacillus tengchongensis]